MMNSFCWLLPPIFMHRISCECIRFLISHIIHNLTTNVAYFAGITSSKVWQRDNKGEKSPGGWTGLRRELPLSVASSWDFVQPSSNPGSDVSLGSGDGDADGFSNVFEVIGLVCDHLWGWGGEFFVIWTPKVRQKNIGVISNNESWYNPYLFWFGLTWRFGKTSINFKHAQKTEVSDKLW